MKSKKLNLIAAVVASSVVGATAVPATASAEVAASASIASMYLWRGQDISDGAPALSGDVTYTHSSGAYAFGWMSSEGVKDSTDASTESYEVDFGAGYAGSVGDFGYDVYYYKFWYPEGGESFSDAGAEVVIGLSYDPVTFTAYLDAKGDKTYKYYTLSGGYGDFSATIGATANDADNTDYKHFDISYQATPELSFTYSKPFSVDSGAGIDTDPLFVLTYSLPITAKK